MLLIGKKQKLDVALPFSHSFIIQWMDLALRNLITLIQKATLSSFQNVSKHIGIILFYLPAIILFWYAEMDSECQFFAIPGHTLPR